MNVKETIKRAQKRRQCPYKAVASEWDRCEPDEVNEQRATQVKRMVKSLLFHHPEYKNLP